jgi:hypothetical protein
MYMPYRLRKAPGHDEYFVEGPSGRKSIKPLPLARAHAQQRALYAAEARGGRAQHMMPDGSMMDGATHGGMCGGYSKADHERIIANAQRKGDYKDGRVFPKDKRWLNEWKQVAMMSLKEAENPVSRERASELLDAYLAGGPEEDLKPLFGGAMTTTKFRMAPIRRQHKYASIYDASATETKFLHL